MLKAAHRCTSGLFRVFQARRHLLLLLLIAIAGQAAPVPAQNGPLPPAAREEIGKLLQFVESSGCEFYRNGSWHNSKAARDHLAMKYEYALERNLLKNTEDFISKIASESSMTGFDYKVRCGGGPTITSAEWLRGELVRIRSPSPPATK